MTRGDPGIYLTPSFNGSLGMGVKAEGSLNYSAGWYTGDPSEINRSMLAGHTIGANLSVKDMAGFSLGVSYSPLDINHPEKGGFINGNVGVGVGASLSLDGVYQYTPGAGTLWSQKKSFDEKE